MTNLYGPSELKSLLSVIKCQPEIHPEGLSLFFQLTYIPAPYTIYKSIYKLEPNNYIDFDLINNNYKIVEIKRKYNQFEYSSKKDAIKITQELVNKSIESRSISDVPIGTFLSGGVDSSIVSLCLSKQTEKKINTFSIGFNKKSFDETDKSRLVSKLINSNHHEFIIAEDTLVDNLNEIILNFDEPFADSSALATYLVSNKTKDYVKVALTGDGGDEGIWEVIISIIWGFFNKKIYKYNS